MSACFSSNVVSEVFIPTAKEYEEWVSMIPNIPMESKKWCWLRTPGKLSCRMQVINYDGTICENGGNVADPSIGVRPAFHFNLALGMPGDRVNIGRITATMTSMHTALCDEILFKSRIRANEDEGNNFEGSELEAILQKRSLEIIG